MLKLKLLYTIIKRNWKIPIYLFLAFFAFKFYWNIKAELRTAQRREHNLKCIVFKATKGLRTTANVNKELEGVYLLEQKTSAHWKAIALKGSGTQTQIDSNRTKVAFDMITDCISLEGFTLTNPPYWEIPKLELVPFWMNIKVMDFENKVYSWTTSSPCVQIDSVNLEVSPDIKGICRCGFDKGDFFLGGIIVGCGVVIYNLLQ